MSTNMNVLTPELAALFASVAYDVNRNGGTQKILYHSRLAVGFFLKVIICKQLVAVF